MVEENETRQNGLLKVTDGSIVNMTARCKLVMLTQTLL